MTVVLSLYWKLQKLWPHATGCDESLGLMAVLGHIAASLLYSLVLVQALVRQHANYELLGFHASRIRDGNGRGLDGPSAAAHVQAEDLRV